jgi:serine/threonine protein kinase
VKKAPITFGQYHLLDRINIGGMAEVYKAKVFGQDGGDRLVAIKRILPNIAEDNEFVTMFIDEAKIAVHLTHPNIAQIFDLGQINGSYFIALEYVSGKDLRSIFDRARKTGGTIPLSLACYVIGKLCDGLDYAHRRKDAANRDLNIVHRDISPQNCLISYDGDVKLIDFGIAKAANKASKTQAGILKGKFGYMSPEQVRGVPLDRRSDIFAAGVCLYEVITGERLFVADSDFSTLEKVRNVDIKLPSVVNKAIPTELEHIVLKALRKDVEDRFQWASELGDELQKFVVASATLAGREDLSAYMKSTFAEEYKREQESQREAAAYQAPAAPAPPRPRPSRPAVASVDAQVETELMIPNPNLGRPVEPRTTPGMATTPAAPRNSNRDEMPTPAFPRPVPGNNGAQRPLPPGKAPSGKVSRTPSGAFNRNLGKTRHDGPSEPLVDDEADSLEETTSSGYFTGNRRIAHLVLMAAVAVALGGFIGFIWRLAGDPASATGTVLVTADIPGAELYVDSTRQEGNTPWKLNLRRGAHVIEVKKAGYQTFIQELVMVAGRTEAVEVRLVPSGTALVVVYTDPADAEIVLDDRMVRERGSGDPVWTGEVTSGKAHVLLVRAPGFQDFRQDFSLQPNSHRKFAVKLTRMAAARPR